MKSFIDDLKNEWKKPNNMVMRIILINVIVWIIFQTAHVFSWLLDSYTVFNGMKDFVFLNSNLYDFIWKPWTIITYGFANSDLWHILMNMLMMYWFGTLLRDFIGANRVLGVYILGVLGGGIAFLLLYNLAPGFSQAVSMIDPATEQAVNIKHVNILLGASAGVYGVVVAMAALRPNMQIHLLLIGPVKMRYIALVMILLSFFALVGDNSGGNMAHLGGALVGYLFALQYKKGNDLSSPITQFLQWAQALWNNEPKMKASSGKKKKKKAKTTGSGTRAKEDTHNSSKAKKQEVIDRILDKISESGYESLSAEEKQTLFRASQK